MPAGGGFLREPDSGGFRSASQTPCPMEWGGGSRGAARNPATVPDRCSPSTNTIGQNTQINGALKPKRETKWLDTCDAQMDSLGSKSSLNGSKMMPKWSQKRSREGPGGVLEATWAPDGPQSRPGVILAWFGCRFGTILGDPKSNIFTFWSDFWRVVF